MVEFKLIYCPERAQIEKAILAFLLMFFQNQLAWSFLPSHASNDSALSCFQNFDASKRFWRCRILLLKMSKPKSLEWAMWLERHKRTELKGLTPTIANCPLMVRRSSRPESVYWDDPMRLKECKIHCWKIPIEKLREAAEWHKRIKIAGNSV